jgi:hypothetical protein
MEGDEMKTTIIRSTLQAIDFMCEYGMGHLRGNTTLQSDLLASRFWIPENDSGFESLFHVIAVFIRFPKRASQLDIAITKSKYILKGIWEKKVFIASGEKQFLKDWQVTEEAIQKQISIDGFQLNDFHRYIFDQLGCLLEERNEKGKLVGGLRFVEKQKYLEEIKKLKASPI